MPRGCVVFGSVWDEVRNFGRDTNTAAIAKGEDLSFVSIADKLQGDAIVISPLSGLIGVPRQVDMGIELQCLLNPELVVTYPPKWIKLDLSQIRAEKAVFGRPISILDTDGFYLVVQVRHYGDTRGEDWYTEIVGLTLAGKIDLRLANESINLPKILTDKNSDMR